MSRITVTPENLRSIAKTCRAQASEINSVERTVNAAIVNSGWNSPAATKFKNDWNTDYRKALAQLDQALRSLGDAATKMATNYEATERAYQGVR